MSSESISQLAKQNKVERPEKSQEDLRNALEKHLFSLKPTIEEEVKKYKEASENDTFEDKENEPEGSGEKRKEEMQNRINSIIEKASAIKEKLDSKEPLPQSTPEISATYTRRDNKKETITLDLEQKLQEFTDFYNKTKLDLPLNFEETIKDIWENNQTEIQEAIEQNGFDDLLIVPGNIPLADLAEKMKMGKGYYEGGNFKSGGSFAGAVSQNVDKPRIILYHHTETLSKISQRTGLDVHLNITGTDVEKLFKSNPNNYLSTLEDFLILERKYFEDTGKHLSDWNNKNAHWLPGTKAGARLVRSSWDSGRDGLYVGASDLDYRDDGLGVRPSRSFF